MYPAYIGLEVEDLDKTTVLWGGQLFLGNSLGVNLREVVEVCNGVFSRRFTVESVGARLVNTNFAALLFAGNLRLLDQGVNQFLDRPRLGDMQIVLVLSSVSI